MVFKVSGIDIHKEIMVLYTTYPPWVCSGMYIVLCIPVHACMSFVIVYDNSPGGAITALLLDLPIELTACTAMLVYTLFLSSPAKL